VARRPLSKMRPDDRREMESITDIYKNVPA
jgi:hypothetical protein